MSLTTISSYLLMNDLSTRLVIDLKNDQLLKGLKQSSKNMQLFAKNTDRSMRQGSKSLGLFVSKSTRDFNRLNQNTR